MATGEEVFGGELGGAASSLSSVHCSKASALERRVCRGVWFGAQRGRRFEWASGGTGRRCAGLSFLFRTVEETKLWAVSFRQG